MTDQERLDLLYAKRTRIMDLEGQPSAVEVDVPIRNAMPRKTNIW